MTALCQTPSLQLLYGISKHGLFAAFNSLEGVANLVLSILLVRHLGLLGVALGTMIPMAFTKLFVQPWYFCRVMHFDLWEYYALLVKSLFAAVVALLLPAVLVLRYSAPDYTDHDCAAGGFHILFCASGLCAAFHRSRSAGPCGMRWAVLRATVRSC